METEVRIRIGDGMPFLVKEATSKVLILVGLLVLLNRKKVYSSIRVHFGQTDKRNEIFDTKTDSKVLKEKKN